MVEHEGKPGVWVIYDHDQGPVAHSIHADPVEAIRLVAQQGYGKVAFWPLGWELLDAVATWETS